MNRRKQKLRYQGRALSQDESESEVTLEQQAKLSVIDKIRGSSKLSSPAHSPRVRRQFFTGRSQSVCEDVERGMVSSTIENHLHEDLNPQIVNTNSNPNKKLTSITINAKESEAARLANLESEETHFDSTAIETLIKEHSELLENRALKEESNGSTCKESEKLDHITRSRIKSLSVCDTVRGRQPSPQNIRKISKHKISTTNEEPVNSSEHSNVIVTKFQDFKANCNRKMSWNNSKSRTIQSSKELRRQGSTSTITKEDEATEDSHCRPFHDTTGSLEGHDLSLRLGNSNLDPSPRGSEKMLHKSREKRLLVKSETCEPSHNYHSSPCSGNSPRLSPRKDSSSISPRGSTTSVPRDQWWSQKSLKETVRKNMATLIRPGAKHLEGEQLAQLLRTTKFTEAELQDWYTKFRRKNPSGYIKQGDIKKLFEDFFKDGNPEEIVHHIMGIFDTDGNGHLDFQELMTALSIVNRGSKEEKLRFAFSMVDKNKNGTIERDELVDVITALHNLVGVTVTRFREGEEDTPETNAARMMGLFDEDQDGEITFEEFVRGVERDPNVVYFLMGQADPNIICSSFK